MIACCITSWFTSARSAGRNRGGVAAWRRGAGVARDRVGRFPDLFAVADERLAPGRAADLRERGFAGDQAGVVGAVDGEADEITAGGDVAVGGVDRDPGAAGPADRPAVADQAVDRVVAAEVYSLSNA